jgi:PsbP-like protein
MELLFMVIRVLSKNGLQTMRMYAIVKITINKNDAVTVIIGCSLDPIPVDYNGIIRLFTILALSEGFLQGLTVMNNNCGLGQSQSIPSYGKWIITRWDFGRDALQTYNGYKFEITVENAQNIFARIYTKDFGNSTSAMTWNTSSPPISKPSNSSYLTYNDKDIGFSIQYPSDWTIENRNAQFSSVIGFIAPDGISEVDVRVFPKEDYKSIKEFGDKEFKNSDDYTLLGYYRNSTTMLDGKPAFRAIYLAT